MADLLESRRCTAKSKRSQERCRRAAVIGGTVCAMHGGKAPQVKAAAEARDLEQKATVEIDKLLWRGLANATPVKDPVASLERLAGALEQAVDVVGGKVNELGHVAGGTGLTQMRGEVVLLERLLGQLRQALDAMARLGIAERHVELEQERAQLVTAAFLAALSAITLLPADRDLMLRTFLQGLGRGPEVLEASGGAA
jgi:hypothetical protein